MLKLDNFYMLRLLRNDVFLNQSEKLLLMLLVTYRIVQTLECCPNQETLAINYGKSKWTVLRRLRDLEAKRYIIGVQRGDGKKQNYYFLSDFNLALEIGRQPGFKGDKRALAKANRKRFIEPKPAKMPSLK